MTTEEHLRTIIGDLVLRIAQLSAEVDTVKTQLAARGPEHNADPSSKPPRQPATSSPSASRSKPQREGFRRANDVPDPVAREL
jgi:hypothetical protein